MGENLESGNHAAWRTIMELPSTPHFYRIFFPFLGNENQDLKAGKIKFD
jgi:hypothetical protein